MDKSDVDKEDAEGFLNNLKESQDAIAIPAAQVRPEMSAALEGNSEHAAVDCVVEEHSNPVIELQEQNEPSCYVKCKEDDQLNDAEHEKAGAEKEEQSAVKCHLKNQTDMEHQTKEQNSFETSKEVEGTVFSLVEDQKSCENAEVAENLSHNGQLPFQLPVSEVPPKKKEAVHEVPQSHSEEMMKRVVEDVHKIENEGLVNGCKEPESKSVLPTSVYDGNVELGYETATKMTKQEVGDAPHGYKHESATPDIAIKYSSKRSGSHTGEVLENIFSDAQMLEDDDGTPEEQAAFMKELESFYRERGSEFKPPKFYGKPLNCCKLWRSVIRLGGYDRVTGSKLWRQVGESFHPPKTCTTVSWTFRIFYEKSLLEYERHKIQTGELQLPAAAVAELANVDNEGNGFQASGSGRARRDAAARAMKGWHVQRHLGYGEVSEPIIKEKSLNNMQKRENKLKSIGSLKQKRPSEIELPAKTQRTETYRQLMTTVVDVGPPADWVKINVRETNDCFEVYALVPGLLREEVRVQSDPAGRLVITGQPEQPDNPWGITAFKKVVSLPSRIDPVQTSAVVSLHGRLFVRVPFEQVNV